MRCFVKRAQHIPPSCSSLPSAPSRRWPQNIMAAGNTQFFNSRGPNKSNQRKLSTRDHDVPETVSGDVLTLRGKLKRSGDVFKVTACGQQGRDVPAGVKAPHPFWHNLLTAPASGSSSDLACRMLQFITSLIKGHLGWLL